MVSSCLFEVLSFAAELDAVSGTSGFFSFSFAAPFAGSDALLSAKCKIKFNKTLVLMSISLAYSVTVTFEELAIHIFQEFYDLIKLQPFMYLDCGHFRCRPVGFSNTVW